ncbi:hypothetical protein PT974_08490 [Cladobotryum mycophilum]|uniref:AMP-activated protein kinase glycogen-binding domain-containing protein n=1 Tax=Cladobotryum mycophilum TaxID=491253 RepID=A0ABR0SDK3_9HYPO
MAAAVKVPYTIIYRNSEAQSPVFLAGTFTNPEWLLQEMEPSLDDHGQHVFKATVFVEPEKDYQFRFKMGHQEAWIIDESKPITEDDSGSRNNFMNVPLDHHSSRQSYLAAAMENDGELASRSIQSQPQKPFIRVSDLNERTSTPIEQVAAVAAEVADTAEKLDAEESSPPHVSVSGGESENEDDLKTPLFAHECFGAYEFVDDGLDHDNDFESQQRRNSRAKSTDYTINQLDLNDPTLERFPSEKSSVLDTLRKIQSSTSEDQLHLDDPNSRRTSVDSADDIVFSPASLSPTTTRRRDNRMSTSSVRNRSLASLGSIAEEPKPRSTDSASSAHQKKGAPFGGKNSGIDDGETLMMKSARA